MSNLNNRGHGILLSRDVVSDHRVQDEEKFAPNRGEYHLSGLAAPAQTGAGIADGKTVVGGVYGGHAGNRAHGGAIAPGAVPVPRCGPGSGGHGDQRGNLMPVAMIHFQ